MSSTKPESIVSVPPYRLHKSSGRAYVNLNRQRVYLGRYDQPESRAEYDRVITEWLANGRQRRADPATLTVNELAARFWRHAESYYRHSHGIEPARQSAEDRTAIRDDARSAGRPIDPTGDQRGD